MTASTPIPIREILFPTDFSAHSDHAFRAARALADHFGARLHLFHVVHASEEREHAVLRLEAFAAERLAGQPFVVSATVGTPAAEIVKQAERQDVDLIVMGTHGRTGLAHLVMGSVAEAVVRRAPCQVLTIRREVELSLEAPSAARPSPAAPEPLAPEPLRHEGHAGYCLVCALPSPDLVCETCKARIRGEVLYRKLQDEKAGR